MKKTMLLFGLCLITGLNTVSAQTDSVKTYLTDALNIMKKRSVNKASIDWDKLYAESYGAAAQFKTISESYPIIRKALKSLNDAHSNFFPPEMVKSYTLGYRATGQKFPQIDTAFLANKYAYISLPAIASYNFDDWNEYVNTFRAKIAQLQALKPKGWIIDIRDNEGGMFYPMYAAIAPFLDQQKVIGIKDAEGKLSYFGYKDSKLSEGKEITHRFALNKTKLKKIKQPIVILINRGTGSSAEFSAISFVGQQHVTFVGQNTTGLTSGNQEHRLRDGAFLVLTEGNIIDRNQKEYAKIGEGLTPDIKLVKLPTTNQKATYLNKAIEVLDQSKR